MMTKIDFVNFEDVFDEFVSYLEANKTAMREYADSSLDIDWNQYRAAAEDGSMMMVTLRNEDRLVGFSVFVLSKSLREKNTTEAENHGLYIEKNFRAKYGKRIIEASDRFLRSLGVLNIYYTNDNPVFGRLLATIGYAPKYTIWEKTYG